MEDDKTLGSILLASLKEKGLKKSDIGNLFKHVLENPVYKGSNIKYKGFCLNEEAKLLFTLFQDRYVFLTRKYHIPEEGIKLNELQENSIIEYLRILTDDKVDEFERSIEAFQSNLEIEKEMVALKDDTIFKEGSFSNMLKVAFKKHFS